MIDQNRDVHFIMMVNDHGYGQELLANDRPDQSNRFVSGPQLHSFVGDGNLQIFTLTGDNPWLVVYDG